MIAGFYRDDGGLVVQVGNRIFQEHVLAALQAAQLQRQH